MSPGACCCPTSVKSEDKCLGKSAWPIRRTMRTARHTLANLFRGSDLKIGVRLTTCFLTIVVLMIAGDAVSIWQLRQLEAHTKVLKTADKASSAIVRLHLDVNSFSGRVAVLTRVTTLVSSQTKRLCSERRFCGMSGRRTNTQLFAGDRAGRLHLKHPENSQGDFAHSN